MVNGEFVEYPDPQSQRENVCECALACLGWSLRAGSSCLPRRCREDRRHRYDEHEGHRGDEGVWDW
jgi:hypothetical protein